MKCDELQYERLGDANKTYPSSTLVIRKQFGKRNHYADRCNKLLLLAEKFKEAK